jgi:hypothetical protein
MLLRLDLDLRRPRAESSANWYQERVSRKAEQEFSSGRAPWLSKIWRRRWFRGLTCRLLGSPTNLRHHRPNRLAGAGHP